MAAPRGHPRYGGRSAGIPNKATMLRQEALAQAYANAGLTPERISEVTPLQAMLICMHWALEEKNPQAVLAAASAAAPYVHPKLSSSDVRITGDLTTKSDAELVAEIAELETRIAAARMVN
jgi:hypothetical protein